MSKPPNTFHKGGLRVPHPTTDLPQQRDRRRVVRVLPRGGRQLHLDDLHAGREGVVDLQRGRMVALEAELQSMLAEMV